MHITYAAHHCVTSADGRWNDDMHYVTSRDDFEKLSGWNNPIDSGYLREKIEQSGNNNAEARHARLPRPFAAAHRLV